MVLVSSFWAPEVLFPRVKKGHFHFVGLSIDHLKYSNGKKAQGSGPKIPEIENTESLDRNPETE